MNTGEGPSTIAGGYDALREFVTAELDRERQRALQFAGWLTAGQLLLVGLYGSCLKELAGLSSQEPATYPKENVPVAALAWFTAWGLPMLGLALALFMVWRLAASAVHIRGLTRHWHSQEGLAASQGQRFPAGLYPPVRAGGWSLLLLPVLFLSLWFVAMRLYSAGIEAGIENWRAIPQDQA